MTLSTSTVSPSADQVREYYNAFSSSRMLSYRLSDNPRIKRAIHFFVSSLDGNEAVLDVGCGIGIATEAIAKNTAGPVLGVDISDQNIWYAQKSIKLANLSFVAADALSAEFDPVALLGTSPSVITMCDVIEHIPEKSRVFLFQRFADLGGPGLKVHLTFPTAAHLEYLEHNEPAEIQIIDNMLPPETLASEAARAGLCMTYFKMIDVWRGYDYAHCTFTRLEDLRTRIKAPIRGSVLSRLKTRLLGPIKRRMRRRRYIDDVFQGDL
jgi:ubiquinone/menaquinone biosynthesis C-methylase UbiE